MYLDLRRPDQHTPKRILVKKSYEYVRTVWSMYTDRNITDFRYRCSVWVCVCIHLEVVYIHACSPIVTEPDLDTEEDDGNVDDFLQDGDALDSGDDMDY